ncbi:MAG: cobalamin-dependent protein [Geothrix sp.]|uniref:B12-binding domain-containing radical SAM protein n=1 Tax=Geothrix sp. TaxID=1962974 RepID=UPI003BB19893
MGSRVVLIRPKPHRESIGLHKFMICEPLELEYLSAYLELQGHHVEIVDMILESGRKLIQLLRERRPDVIGLTGYISHVGVVLDYARRIKEALPGVVTVVGGVHAEVNPGDFEDNAIDFVVKANGMKTMALLLEALGNGRSVGDIRADVEGIWNGPGKTYVPEKGFAYPFPDREKTARYRKRYNYIFHEKCATLKSSFGCTYKCEFCYCVAITQGRYFARDIAEVVEEVKTIREENIFIVDDNFLVSLERVQEFCRLLDKEGLQKNFILFGRADFIVEHPDHIALLQRHGLKAIFVGIESFREAELEQFQKRTTVAMNIRAVEILDELGIECYSGIIVGTDWERRDFDALIAFLKRFKRPLLNVQPLTPMPGTPLFERIKGQVTVPREDYHLWDMAHMLIDPTRMSRRAFYLNIIRVYYKASTGFQGHWYVLRRYGFRIFARTAYGALHLTWQYLLMALRG